MNKVAIEEIRQLDRQQLAMEWEKVFRCPAPKSVGKRFLLGALAYQSQAGKAGGLKASTKRRLFSHLAEPPRSILAASKLQAGTRLVREWNGAKHVVDVIEGGFVWNGQTFKSLSAIAREITGARWSGPRFFGL